MSWQPRVAEVVCVPSPWLPPFHRPLISPVSRIGEDARAVDDLGQLGMRERHLDDDDGEDRGIGILVGIAAGAAGELSGRTDARGAGDVDVDVVLVFGVDDQGVGVRAAAGLDVSHLLGVVDVGDVEDADALDAVRAGTEAALLEGRHGGGIGCGIAGRSRRCGRRLSGVWRWESPVCRNQCVHWRLRPT